MKKAILFVVTLHPKRKCRAREWLEKPSVKNIADIQYLEPLPLGEKIYGKGGQEYTAAPIGRAMYEAVCAALKADGGAHPFFGTCCDDVVVETSNFFKEAMQMLTLREHYGHIDVVGAAHGQEAIAKDSPLKPYCYRVWLALSQKLNCVAFMDWWPIYEFSGDWEGPWHNYIGLRPRHFPDLKWNHLVPVALDTQLADKGYYIESFEGEHSYTDKTKKIMLEELQ